MFIKILAGSSIGLAIGLVIGYIGKSAGGTCPLSCNPWRSGIFGVIIGLLFAFSAGCAPKSSNPVSKAKLDEIITVEAFKASVLETDGPVLVKFHAVWCGPCRALTPIIEGLSEEYTGRVGFYSIDVDKAEVLASTYNIQSVPTIIVFNKGQLHKKLIGSKGVAEYRQVLDEIVDK